MNVVRNWFSTGRSVVTDPDGFYASATRTGRRRDALGYAAISSLVTSGTLGLLSVALNVSTPVEALAGGALLVVFFGGALLLSYVLQAAIAHGIVSVLGGSDLSLTMEAFAYPTVLYPLSFVPLLNLLVGVYAVYLQSKGLASVHGFSTGKGAAIAIAAALLSWVPVVVGVVLFAAVLGSFILGMGTPV